MYFSPHISLSLTILCIFTVLLTLPCAFSSLDIIVFIFKTSWWSFLKSSSITFEIHSCTYKALPVILRNIPWIYKNSLLMILLVELWLLVVFKVYLRICFSDLLSFIGWYKNQVKEMVNWSNQIIQCWAVLEWGIIIILFV